jgi:hypothetical protein
MNDLSEFPTGQGRSLAETAGARQDQSRELADLQVNYLMAQQFPRDERAGVDRILNAFSRPDLAEKSQYSYSKGGTDIRGPSIKAMEAIAGAWRNIDTGWRVRSRGVDSHNIPFSEIEAYAVDLEARTRKRIAFIVPHWRDRSAEKGGGYVLTDERDVYELCANMAQRRLRACIEAVIPADVIERAMTQADVTLKSKADTSPEAMGKMVDAFAPFGVTKEHIEKRIQRRLDAITPAQVVNLKRVYASLRDGMSDPGEWFDMGDAAAVGDADDEPEAEGTGTAAVKSRLKKKAAGKAPKPTPKAKAEGAGDGNADEKTGAKADAKGAPAQATDKAADNGPLTYAHVAAALNDAPDTAALDAASVLIKRVPDAKQRTELELMYSARAGEFDDEQG